MFWLYMWIMHEDINSDVHLTAAQASSLLIVCVFVIFAWVQTERGHWRHKESRLCYLLYVCVCVCVSCVGRCIALRWAAVLMVHDSSNFFLTPTEKPKRRSPSLCTSIANYNIWYMNKYTILATQMSFIIFFFHCSVKLENESYQLVRLNNLVKHLDLIDRLFSQHNF